MATSTTREVLKSTAADALRAPISGDELSTAANELLAVIETPVTPKTLAHAKAFLRLASVTALTDEDLDTYTGHLAPPTVQKSRRTSYGNVGITSARKIRIGYGLGTQSYTELTAAEIALVLKEEANIRKLFRGFSDAEIRSETRESSRDGDEYTVYYADGLLPIGYAKKGEPQLKTWKAFIERQTDADAVMGVKTEEPVLGIS